MGEVLFKYWPRRTPMYQIAFNYWYSRTTEYRFAYHRYVTSVDASKLKGPVAITKVAAGFRCIEDGFWAYDNSNDLYDINKTPEHFGDQVNHLEEFSIQPFSERNKNLIIMKGNSFMYSSKEMDMLKDIFINRDILMTIYKDIRFTFSHNKVIEENNEETLSSAPKDVIDKESISIVPASGKSLNKNDNIAVHKDMPIGVTLEQINAEKTFSNWSVFEQVITSKIWPKLNVFEQISANKDQPGFNVYPQVITGKSWPQFNIYEQVYAKRVWPELHIYEQIMSKKIRALSENIFEQLSGSTIWKLMDIYNYMYSTPYNKPLNEIPNTNIAERTNSALNHTPTLNAEVSDDAFQTNWTDFYTVTKILNIANILENIHTCSASSKQLIKQIWWRNFGITEPDIEWKIFEEIMMSIDGRNMNHYENILTNLPSRTLNSIVQLFGWRNDSQIIIDKDEQAESNSIIVNIRNDIIGSTGGSQVNWISQIYGERPQPDPDIYDMYIAYKTDKYLPVYVPNIDVLPIYKKSPIVNVLQEINGIKDSKEVICNLGYSIEKPPTTDTILNWDTFAIQDAKYAVVFNESSLQKDGKKVDGLSFTPIFSSKINNQGWSLFQQYQVSKDIKTAMVLYKEEFVYDNYKYAMSTQSAMLDKYGKIIITQNTYPFLERKTCKKSHVGKNIWLNDSINNKTASVYDGEFVKKGIWELFGGIVGNIWGSRDKRPMRIDNTADEWALKDKKPMNRIQAGMYAKREDYQLSDSLSENEWLYRKDYPLSGLKDRIIWTNRTKYTMKSPEYENWIKRTNYEIWTEERILDIHRTLYGINNTQPDTFLQKTKYELEFIKNAGFVHRKSYVLSRFDQPEIIHKLMKPIQDIEDIESVWRTSYPLELFIGIGSEPTGIYVPITKTLNHAFINRMDEFLWRCPYFAGNSFNGTFASPIPREAWMEYNPLFSFREPYQTMLDYKNEMIFKLNVKSAMQRKIWSCDNVLKHAIIDIENEWTSKDATIISNTYHQPEWLKNGNKRAWIRDTIELFYKIPKNLGMYGYTDAWLNSTPNMIYYTYGVFANNIPKDLGLFINNTPDAERQKKDFDVIDSELWFDRRWRDIFIEDVVFSNREMYESDLFQEAAQIQRECKEIEEFTNDFSNWAWVYEVPDPIEPVFGIDELLLPENDTRYSDFEELIFNPKTMRPRNPVKKIDNTTFIAKYPTKHPFPERANVGRYYDDSAVKFDNYYGIESEVMYMVYLQFFKIWQSKIFEFGGMDMVNATKKMLEYIYTWIVGGGLPLEKLQQGLRVYRQIRWYAESAVIRNSQYVVTYELDALHSNLHTGKCDIPNDIKPGGTMFVDKNLAVIRCDPNTVNNGPASVTFFLDTYRNSMMTFSLLNTIGSVNIYVDGVLVDTRTSSGRVSVDLIYTGDTIEVKIEKDATNNRNKYFYIGDITVPDLSYKDLKVSFDPTLKMGNKPLDEVMKKMIQYANLYDDINEAYDHVRKGNLGVNETYRLMLQYWELHHKNKIKGKRLTIKET